MAFHYMLHNPQIPYIWHETVPDYLLHLISYCFPLPLHPHSLNPDTWLNAAKSFLSRTSTHTDPFRHTSYLFNFYSIFQSQANITFSEVFVYFLFHISVLFILLLILQLLFLRLITLFVYLLICWLNALFPTRQ